MASIARFEAPAPHTLQARLDAAFADVGTKRVVIGCSYNGTRTFAAAGAEKGTGEPGEQAFATGCVTKLLVAALVERTFGEIGLGIDAPLERLPGIGAPHPAFRSTSARHLLEHTHGLDDSNILTAPLGDDGLVDLEGLLGRLESQRFAAPGRLYSYGNAGAWVLAAVLERLHGQPFAALLRRRLLATMAATWAEPRTGSTQTRSAGTTAPPPSARIDALATAEFAVPMPPVAAGNRLCPGTGGALVMSVSSMLGFLESRAASARGWPTSGIGSAARITPLPGWHPLERGIRLGWKHYGAGCFGHHSTWPGASLMLRVRPREGFALVVASTHHAAAVIGAKVLRRELPELRELRLPRRVPAPAAARINFQPYCGRYASAAESLSVGVEAGSLVLAAAGSRRSLSPADGHVFFTDTAAADGRAFVQFVQRHGEAFRLLWDGRRVFRLAE